MGYYWLTYWFIPDANATERRFSETLRHISGLPLTRVPIYEPRHPDAPLFSTVKVPTMEVQGLFMDFDASTGSAASFNRRPLGLEFLRSSVRTLDVSVEERYDRLFVTTIGRIAEGIGALYGVYGYESDFTDIDSFDELWHLSSVYHFISDPLVGLVGRTCLDELGRTTQFDNGIVLHLDHPFDVGLRGVLYRLWKESDLLKGECVPRDSRALPRSKDIQDIAAPNVDPFGLFLDDDTAFFLMYVPTSSLSLEKCRELLRNRCLVPYPGDFLGCREMTDSEVAEWGATFLLKERERFFEYRPSTVEGQLIYGSTPLRLSLISHQDAAEAITGRMLRPDLDVVLLTVTLNNIRAGQAPFLNIVALAATNFEPIYGFGGLDFTSFALELKRMGPPEDRLWPMNLYSAQDGGGPVGETIREFAEQGRPRWAVQGLTPSTVLLFLNDLGLDEQDLVGERGRLFIASMRRALGLEDSPGPSSE